MTHETDGWVARGVDAARQRLDGEWAATQLHGTGGGEYGSSVSRLRSDAGTVVVKVIRRNTAAAADPGSWRRELEVYGSPWLAARLPEGLELPRCELAFEMDECAVIVLEDVPFDDPDERGADWYARLAERLGRLAAGPIESVPPWASRGFVASDADRLDDAIATMSVTSSPYIGGFMHAWRAPLRRLVDALPRLLASLGERPTGFQHLDAFSRNAAAAPGDRFVVIDWAYAGVAPVGTDAAGVVAMTAMYGDADRIGLPRLFEAVVDGYVRGVAAMRPSAVGDELRETIEALLVLRWSGFLAQVHALGDALPEIAESVAGRPLAEVISGWAALSELALPFAERLARAA